MKTGHAPQQAEIVHLFPARRRSPRRARLAAAVDVVATRAARRLIADAPMMSPWLDDIRPIEAARDSRPPRSKCRRHLTLLEGGVSA
jgi:hypothetical protein